LAAVASGADDAIESIAGEACGNWVWLTSFVRRDAALDVGGVVSSMAPALSRHFDVVYHLEPSAALAEFATRRFAQDRLGNVVVCRGAPAALPFRDESFDCVTLHGGAPPARPRSVLAECRRVLRQDGRIYVAFDNPLWYGRLARVTRGRGRRVVPSARAAGFREVECYYAFPTFDRPRVLVPATRRASFARETVEAPAGLRGTARRLATLAGLHAMLAPGVVVVARK
jgi:SAM-dependent methyltransferase